MAFISFGSLKRDYISLFLVCFYYIYIYNNSCVQTDHITDSNNKMEHLEALMGNYYSQMFLMYSKI